MVFSLWCQLSIPSYHNLYNLFTWYLIRSLSSLLTRNKSQIILICFTTTCFYYWTNPKNPPNAKSFQILYYVHECQQSCVFKSNSKYFKSTKMLISSSDSLEAYACAMFGYWIKCIKCLTCIKYYWRRKQVNSGTWWFRLSIFLALPFSARITSVGCTLSLSSFLEN